MNLFVFAHSAPPTNNKDISILFRMQMAHSSAGIHNTTRRRSLATRCAALMNKRQTNLLLSVFPIPNTQFSVNSANRLQSKWFCIYIFFSQSFPIACFIYLWLWFQVLTFQFNKCKCTWRFFDVLRRRSSLASRTRASLNAGTDDESIDNNEMHNSDNESARKIIMIIKTKIGNDDLWVFALCSHPAMHACRRMNEWQGSQGKKCSHLSVFATPEMQFILLF